MMFIADLHFSEKPPLIRTNEEDWIRVQKNCMGQVQALKELYNVPVVIAGDIFDKWNSSAYLINHVMSWLRDIKPITICGNHDTPEHSYRQLDRSAYWTLVEAGIVEHLTPGMVKSVNEVRLFPLNFGWEREGLDKFLPGNGLIIDVAVIHSYIWTKTTGHERASVEDRYSIWAEPLRVFDVAVFGDNHIPFHLKPEGQCQVWNAGCLIRRNATEIKLRPRVGLLHSDGSMEPFYLDISQDKFLEAVAEETSDTLTDLDEYIRQFAEHLAKADVANVEFDYAVKTWMQDHPMSDEVRCIIQTALEVGGKNAKRK